MLLRLILVFIAILSCTHLQGCCDPEVECCDCEGGPAEDDDVGIMGSLPIIMVVGLLVGLVPMILIFAFRCYRAQQNSAARGQAQAAAFEPAPEIPGWDGVSFSTMMQQAELQLQGGFLQMSVSPQPLVDLIGAAHTAGKGFKLTAVVLPVEQSGKHKGRPIDGYLNGLTSQIARATCYFTRDGHDAEMPLETKIFSAPITTSGVFGAHASGYEGLYAQLRQAGQEGYSLSCVVDQPDAKFNGLGSSETTVMLICQRAPGTHLQREYLVVNCPIALSGGISGDISASMPQLEQILRQYIGNGYKIASIYNPPTLSLTGLGSASSACHIIFEKTSHQYTLAIKDAIWSVTLLSPVDHNQYFRVVEQYVKKGWELAAVIDMPDVRLGLSTVDSTVKLFFQAKVGYAEPSRA